MAPSKESQALKELFKTFASNFPADQNNFLERAVYDGVYKAGSEAMCVSYQSTTVAGRDAIWAKPVAASQKHVMLFMHGGGYSFGSPGSHRRLQGHLAKACNVNALSIDYRLAPEHPFPAPLDDCVAAYKHLLDEGYPAENIVVAGDSCGGGLSGAVPLAAVQRGLPVPGASVSLSPLYDLTLSGESMTTNEEVDVLNTRPFVDTLANRYTAGDESLRKNPLLSPLFGDVKGLNPHWISCGGDDMLLSDGIRFAEKLEKAGVEVVLQIHEGQQHVFEFLTDRAPESAKSIHDIGLWVRSKLGS